MHEVSVFAGSVHNGTIISIGRQLFEGMKYEYGKYELGRVNLCQPFLFYDPDISNIINEVIRICLFHYYYWQAIV